MNDTELSLEEFFEQQLFRTLDNVLITKIDDLEDAHHLKRFIGEQGKIISWIIDNPIDRIIKFKVLFENGETAYFLGSEMTKILTC